MIYPSLNCFLGISILLFLVPVLNSPLAQFFGFGSRQAGRQKQRGYRTTSVRANASSVAYCRPRMSYAEQLAGSVS
jgi:hypothetical protein